jgi:EpsI family protein
VLVALGWLVAIAGNVLRVVIIVAAGQATSMQSPLVRDHAWLGWVIFGIGITALLWLVGRRLPQSEEISEGLGGTAVRSAKGADRLAWRLTALVATLLAVAIGPVVFSIAVSTARPTFHEATAPLPERVGPWRRSPETEASWRPEFVGADAERQALYRDASGGELNIYVATYVDQRQGKEAVFDENRVYDRARWRDAQSRHQYLVGRDAVPRQVEETLLQGVQDGKRLVWRWYLVGERTLSGRIEAKLASIAAALRGDRSARVVVISAHVQDSLEATRNRLRGFAIGLGEATDDFTLEPGNGVERFD